jgi:hypothetical protein
VRSNPKSASSRGSHMMKKMCHPINGRNNYDTWLDALVPTKRDELMKLPLPRADTMALMLQREQVLRLNEETQLAYCNKSEEDLYEYMSALQLKVVKEFGFSAEYVGILRSAASLYSREEVPFEKLPFYVRYNRSKRGHLVVGDSIEDVALTAVSSSDGKTTPTSLLSYLSSLATGAGVTLIAAGSIT